MKKKLEAELISIAHRILQMKNKSDLDQLLAETQKLHEKLAVLRFVEEHFDGIQPTIGRAQVEQEVEKAFEEKNAVDEPVAEETKPEEETLEAPKSEEKEEVPAETEAPQTDEHAVTEEAETEVSAEADETESEAEEPEEAEDEPEQPEAEAEPSVEEEAQPEEETTENTSEETTEEIADEKEETEEPVEKPSFELSFERVEDSKPGQITFDDLMLHHYDEPVFVKADGSQKEEAIEVPQTPLQPEAVAEAAIALEGTPELEKEIEEVRQDFHHFEVPKAAPVDNHKSIVIGLNDRIGFEKNLFGGSSEDLNRVLSQLNTLGSFAEAKEFINDMVKPDYNNWVGKEEYEQRFLEIVEQKFN